MLQRDTLGHRKHTKVSLTRSETKRPDASNPISVKYKFTYSTKKKTEEKSMDF